jgi:hypothetical protein
MNAKQEAEYRRLDRASRNGPTRRMAADTLAGRGLSRADIWQADSYKRQMLALKQGRT